MLSKAQEKKFEEIRKEVNEMIAKRAKDINACVDAIEKLQQDIQHEQDRAKVDAAMNDLEGYTAHNNACSMLQIQLDQGEKELARLQSPCNMDEQKFDSIVSEMKKQNDTISASMRGAAKAFEISFAGTLEKARAARLERNEMMRSIYGELYREQMETYTDEKVYVPALQLSDDQTTIFFEKLHGLIDLYSRNLLMR